MQINVTAIANKQHSTLIVGPNFTAYLKYTTSCKVLKKLAVRSKCSSRLIGRMGEIEPVNELHREHSYNVIIRITPDPDPGPPTTPRRKIMCE